MIKKPLRIATRRSKLALIQAEMVKQKLLSCFPDAPEPVLIPLITAGDKITAPTLADDGGKGLFIKELEEAILKNEADVAVHSVKDLPGYLPKEFLLAAILEREDARDTLVSTRYTKLEDLPKNAKVGTSSPRRKAYILKHRPDLEVVPFRGNVDTRIQKIKQNECDAAILAVAGLKRLGLTEYIAQPLDHQVMLPAIGQGAIGIECLKDSALVDMLQAINHVPTARAIEAERAFLQALGGDCHTPIAAFAEIRNNILYFEGAVLAPNGSKHYAVREESAIKESARNTGLRAAEKLIPLAGSDFLKSIACRTKFTPS